MKPPVNAAGIGFKTKKHEPRKARGITGRRSIPKSYNMIICRYSFNVSLLFFPRFPRAAQNVPAKHLLKVPVERVLKRRAS